MTGLEDLCTVQLCYREIWWLLTDSNRVRRIFSPVHRPSLPKSHMARVERFELPPALLESDVLPLNYTLTIGEPSWIRTNDQRVAAACLTAWLSVHRKKVYSYPVNLIRAYVKSVQLCAHFFAVNFNDRV